MINTTLLFMQILNGMLLFITIILIVLAFRRMRLYQLTEAQNLIWSLVILFIPLFGAMAFLLTHPKVASDAVKS